MIYTLEGTTYNFINLKMSCEGEQMQTMRSLTQIMLTHTASYDDIASKRNYFRLTILYYRLYIWLLKHVSYKYSNKQNN